METYSIGYNELMDFPFEKYLEFSQIIVQENKEEKRKTQQKKEEMDKRV